MTNKKINRTNTKVRTVSASLLMLFVMAFLAACSSNAVPELMQYGTYGADVATHIARTYPRRVAGQDAERQTAQYIKEQFTDLGYSFEEQTVNLSSGGTSSNIIVRIPGKGFVANESSDENLNYEVYDRRAKSADGLFNRSVIVAARYDSDPNSPEGNQALSDNASGVGALLTLARQLKEYTMGYDITLIALGGGYDNYAGSRAFAATLNETQIQEIDTFFEFRSLYSGDKLYASSGWSSTYPNQKYRLRQPMYELADVAQNESVNSYTGVSLYQNQLSFMIPNILFEQTPPSGMGAPAETVMLREISTTLSDYRVFDQLGVPTVLFESYNFTGDSMEEVSETVDPNFASTNYGIRSTAFDNIETLAQYNDDTELEDRINASAFIVLKGIATGVIGSDTSY